MALVWVQGCTSWVTNPDATTSCAALEWHQAYLIPPEAAGYVDILVSGGFSPEACRVFLADGFRWLHRQGR